MARRMIKNVKMARRRKRFKLAFIDNFFDGIDYGILQAMSFHNFCMEISLT